MSSNQSAANAGQNAQSRTKDGYKLSVEGVLWFLIKELFNLVPLWIWILIIVLILLRFLLGPAVSLILFIHKHVCRGCCPCLTTVHRSISVSETRAEMLERMSKIKLGVWVNEDGSETRYTPLPEEKELMDKINYNIKHVLE